MNINKKLLIESIIVSLFIAAVINGWWIIQGMLITKNYVPNILESYESVDHLQSKVSFGIIDSGGWITWLMRLVGLLCMMIAYYGIRIWLNQKLRKKRS